MLFAALAASGCGLFRGATRAGIEPILQHGAEGFVSEPDPVLAEIALAANIKLIESLVASYPDDVSLLRLAAMARSTYAFGFLRDELEQTIWEHPNDRARQAQLTVRILASYTAARAFAERALADNDEWRKAIDGRSLDGLDNAAFERALGTLEPDDGESLFWLAFAWGGAIQVQLDPVAASQLPKLSAAAARVLALDDHVFFDGGAHLLAGVLAGFRSPALGGDMAAATQHLTAAKTASGLLLPDVLLAELVYAQTEQRSAFESTLTALVDKPLRADRALLDVIAKRKACRLLAHTGDLFLDGQPLRPPACELVPARP